MNTTDETRDNGIETEAGKSRVYKALGAGSGGGADDAALEPQKKLHKPLHRKQAKAEKPSAPQGASKAAKAPVNDYAESVRTARASRVINACLCAALIVAVIALAVWAAFTDYALMAACAALACLVPLTALLVKNLREAKAVADIAYRGVYAARMTRAQQSAVRHNMLPQGQRYYFACFIVLAVAESAALVILSKLLDSDVFLMIMAIFALAALAAAAISSLYLSARLNMKRAFCTVSSRGIIMSREVIPFSAKDGDVSILVRFDDYYMIRYKRTELLGFRHNAVLIFPSDGVLKNGVGEGDDPASVLAGTLGLNTYKVKAAAYSENRDYYTEGAVIKSSAAV